MVPWIPSPAEKPPGWIYIPDYGWITPDLGNVITELPAYLQILFNESIRNLAEQIAELQCTVTLDVSWASQEIEYEIDVACSHLEWVAFTWWDNLKWYIDDIVSAFEKFLRIIHYKTILAVDQVLTVVSPWYRRMKQRIFKSLSELSKALGFGPEFIALAMRTTRTIVLDWNAATGNNYWVGEAVWLDEHDKFLSRLAKNTRRYINNPELIFEDLEADIEERFGNMRGGMEATTFLTIEGILKGVGKAAADIDRLDRDALVLLNGLPNIIKSHIDPRVFDIMNRIDDVINIDINPKIARIDAVIAPFGADIRAAQKAAADAAARILTPKQTLLALPGLPALEQDEVLAGLNALDNRRTADMLLKVSQWSKPVSDEVERLLQLPAPVKPPPVFLTFEHSLAPVPDLRTPVSGSGPFVGDY